MHFYILSIFPEFFQSPLSCGLLARAQDKGLIDFSFINPRDFAEDRHKTVDDRPYGGGPGMVMLLKPLSRAIETLPGTCRKILLSPKGKPFNQDMDKNLASEKEIAFICGRYEGIDARIESLYDLEPVSVGDFVLNGGEVAALCMIEAISRLVPGFMGKEESFTEESFVAGLLEYPHYTRPEVFQGKKVPDVLLSGNHKEIALWRRRKALEDTLNLRPELLDKVKLSDLDINFLKGLERVHLGRNLYLALVHYPVLNKNGQIGTTSLTNLDIHDIGRVSRTFGLGGYYICTPLKDQQQLAARLIKHWISGPGGKANPDRAKALETIVICSYLQDAVSDIAQKTGRQPKIIVTSARETGQLACDDVRELLGREPVLLVLGTGSGLSPEVMKKAHATLRPIAYLSDYNHLSVRSAASIYVDRILGDYFA